MIKTESGVGFRERRVDLECPLSVLVHLRKSVGRFLDAVDAGPRVIVSDADVRQRIIRIELDGAPELCDRFWECVGSELIPKVPALQISVMGFGIIRSALRQLPLFITGELRDKLL